MERELSPGPLSLPDSRKDSMEAAERQLEKLQRFIESGPSDQGEFRMRCPLHGERTASASVNPYKDGGKWWCHVCERGGSITSLIRAVNKAGEDDEAIKKSSGTGFSIDKSRIVDPSAKEPLSWGKVRGWHEHLMNDELKLERFKEVRGLDTYTIQAYQIGFDTFNGRYTIPILDELGNLVNVRRYKVGKVRSGAKMWNATGHGSPPRLYPMDSLMSSKTILVVEGELDALICLQEGIDAVSGTGGAKRWDRKWSQLFEGKHVYFCYDNDKEGRIGAKKAARSVAKYAASVHVMDALLPAERSDVTDWFIEGHTADELRARMDSTEAFETEPVHERPQAPKVDTARIRPAETEDARWLRKPVSMDVTISGRKSPSYAVPHLIHFECGMDQGRKCETCPMLNDWDGNHVGEISPRDGEAVLRFVDTRDTEFDTKLRSTFGINKCQGLTWHVSEEQTVEEIVVVADMDTMGSVADYNHRRVYLVGGDGQTMTNNASRVSGITVPNPKTQRIDFMAWNLEQTVTSIDTFEMTPETAAELSVFQTEDDPLEKCWDIAKDLAANVTGIVGRERLHMAMDFVWHSALNFPFDGHMMKRGWLELLVVGDTRTGKSRIAEQLQSFYKMGAFINCENASFAGLVAGVNETNGTRSVTWGQIPLNDRRLVILDEISGLKLDILGNLSDIRSRGVAQISKIESGQTNARCRAIWISNAREIVEKAPIGLHVIRDVMGKDEDIARFDLAVSVRKDDVDLELINTPDKPHVEHVYTQELCSKLILWAWSRKADQVQWKPDAYRAVYEASVKLGGRYIEDPPLIQASNVREKVARLAVAIAARTFSTDDKGESIIVEKRHVKAAYEFIDKMYSYDNFGYRRVSKREFENRDIAKRNRDEIQRWIQETPKLFRFLVDRGESSFRAQDLEEMTGMYREEASKVLGRLTDACMIRKVKSQIVLEPELRSIVMEVEDARAKARKRGSRNSSSVRTRDASAAGRKRQTKKPR